MSIAPSAILSAWRAELSLDFERRGDRTVLARRQHDGPLLMQKALYPEGDGVCHAIVLHPPAGIAGGDDLRITATMGEGAHALLTTPGATRWYRSSGATARQVVHLHLAAGACLEWFPLENIVFGGALAESSVQVHLAPGARFIGWDVLCLGRKGSGDRFETGRWRLDTRLHAGKALHWMEAGTIAGADDALSAAAALAGASVTGTFMAFAPDLTESVLRELKARCVAANVSAGAGQGSVSGLPGLILGRYLGHSAHEARSFFIGLWQHVRPAFYGLPATEPRIWKT